MVSKCLVYLMKSHHFDINFYLCNVRVIVNPCSKFEPNDLAPFNMVG